MRASSKNANLFLTQRKEYTKYITIRQFNKATELLTGKCRLYPTKDGNFMVTNKFDEIIGYLNFASGKYKWVSNV